MMDGIELEILWSNLIGIVSEQRQGAPAHRLQRPWCARRAISPPRCSTARGRMVAQANTGTPGHINSLAIAGRHLIGRFQAFRGASCRAISC